MIDTTTESFNLLSIAPGHSVQSDQVLEEARIRLLDDPEPERGRRIAISGDGRIARARFAGIMTTRFPSEFGVANPSEMADDVEAMLSSEALIAILSIESPGGEVQGTESAALRIKAAMEEHPDKALIVTSEHLLASAAYWIGSMADLIITSPSATVGSIGVVAIVNDPSKMLADAGIEQFVVKTGPLKAIGNGPLTDDQKEFITSEVNKNFQRFKSAVENARGISLSDEVLSGRTFRGDEATDHGLVDQVGDVEGLLEKAAASIL